MHRGLHPSLWHLGVGGHGGSDDDGDGDNGGGGDTSGRIAEAGRCNGDV